MYCHQTKLHSILQENEEQVMDKFSIQIRGIFQLKMIPPIQTSSNRIYRNEDWDGVPFWKLNLQFDRLLWEKLGSLTSYTNNREIMSTIFPPPCPFTEKTLCGEWGQL